MRQYHPAARAAGVWWADLLPETHSDKRNRFAASVARRVDEAMWWDGDKKRDTPVLVYLEVDNQPRGIILDAVREVIDKFAGGVLSVSADVLPLMHGLVVAEKVL